MNKLTAAKKVSPQEFLYCEKSMHFVMNQDNPMAPFSSVEVLDLSAGTFRAHRNLMRVEIRNFTGKTVEVKCPDLESWFTYEYAYDNESVYTV